jgi:hypothetical protein
MKNLLFLCLLFFFSCNQVDTSLENKPKEKIVYNYPYNLTTTYDYFNLYSVSNGKVDFDSERGLSLMGSTVVVSAIKNKFSVVYTDQFGKGAIFDLTINSSVKIGTDSNGYELHSFTAISQSNTEWRIKSTPNGVGISSNHVYWYVGDYDKH